MTDAERRRWLQLHELTPFKIDVAWNQARPIQTAMPTAQGIIYICWML
jgi:hypothetical protein